MSTNTNDFEYDSTLMKAAKFLGLKKLDNKLMPNIPEHDFYRTQG
jgi:hypothetical protein